MKKILIIMAFLCGVQSYSLNDKCKEEKKTRYTSESNSYNSRRGYIDVQITDGIDDVEESQNGDLYIDSSDLEMTYDGGLQKVGLRFRTIVIPENATITSAYLQFTAEESSDEYAELEIALHDSDDSPVFSATNNISSRPTFSNTVTWEPSAWSSGQNGFELRSPNLKRMIQRLVDKSSWSSGNSLSFVIKSKDENASNSSNNRVAYSYEGSTSRATRLIINYETSNVDNYELDTKVIGDGVVSGEGDYNEGEIVLLTATPDTGWKFTGWTGITGSSIKEYVLMDADKTITANFIKDSEQGLIDVQITNGDDDVEESEDGDLYIDSSDLEMTYDDSFQKIGLRFRSVKLPKNADIINAYLQFTAEESNSEDSELKIGLHNSANSPAFSSSNKVSDRDLISSTVTWEPVSWSSGENGYKQRSPNLRGMVQRLVDNNSWFSGSNLSFIIQGEGVSLTDEYAKRVAYSYEGRSSKATRLIISYEAPEIERYELTTKTSGQGAVSGGGTYDDGALVFLTAIPARGWKFDGWSGASTFFGIAFVTMDDDKRVTANFSVDEDYEDNDDNDGSGYVEVQIADGIDDVEELKNGKLYTDSGDLEMAYDGNLQKVGLRFRGVNIPRDATITSAYIQFTAEERNNEDVELEIALHSSSNSPVFSSSNTVSDRATFGNKVTWKPSSWTTGDAEAAQRTPNLRSMLQRLVDKNSWSTGNNLSFAIKSKDASSPNASNNRVAISYEGKASKAARLIVRFDEDRRSRNKSFGTSKSEQALLAVYPNPFEENISLNMPSVTKSNEEYTVTIYNILGNVVYKENINSSTKTITPRVMTKGIYIFSLANAEGVVIKRERLLKK